MSISSIPLEHVNDVANNWNCWANTLAVLLGKRVSELKELLAQVRVDKLTTQTQAAFQVVKDKTEEAARNFIQRSGDTDEICKIAFFLGAGHAGTPQRAPAIARDMFLRGLADRQCTGVLFLARKGPDGAPALGHWVNLVKGKLVDAQQLSGKAVGSLAEASEMCFDQIANSEPNLSHLEFFPFEEAPGRVSDWGRLSCDSKLLRWNMRESVEWYVEEKPWAPNAAQDHSKAVGGSAPDPDNSSETSQGDAAVTEAKELQSGAVRNMIKVCDQGAIFAVGGLLQAYFKSARLLSDVEDLLGVTGTDGSLFMTIEEEIAKFQRAANDEERAQCTQRLSVYLAAFRSKVMSAMEMCDHSKTNAQLATVSGVLLLGCCSVSLVLSTASGEGAPSVIQVLRIAGLFTGAGGAVWSKQKLEQVGLVMDRAVKVQDMVTNSIEKLIEVLPPREHVELLNVLKDFVAVNHKASASVLEWLVQTGAKVAITDVALTTIVEVASNGLFNGHFGGLMFQIARAAGGPGLIAGAELSEGGAALGGLAATTAFWPALLIGLADQGGAGLASMAGLHPNATGLGAASLTGGIAGAAFGPVGALAGAGVGTAVWGVRNIVDIVTTSLDTEARVVLSSEANCSINLQIYWADDFVYAVPAKKVDMQASEWKVLKSKRSKHQNFDMYARVKDAEGTSWHRLSEIKSPYTYKGHGVLEMSLCFSPCSMVPVTLHNTSTVDLYIQVFDWMDTEFKQGQQYQVEAGKYVTVKGFSNETTDLNICWATEKSRLSLDRARRVSPAESPKRIN